MPISPFSQGDAPGIDDYKLGALSFAFEDTPGQRRVGVVRIMSPQQNTFGIFGVSNENTTTNQDLGNKPMPIAHAINRENVGGPIDIGEPSHQVHSGYQTLG